MSRVFWLSGASLRAFETLEVRDPAARRAPPAAAATRGPKTVKLWRSGLARRTPVTSVAAIIGVMLVAGVPSSASAARPLSWSAPIPPAAEGDLLSAPVVAGGRVLTLQFALAHRATLRSRSLATGRLRTRRVAVPLLRGAEAVAPEGQNSPDSPPLLVDRRGRAVVASTWCGDFVDEAGSGGDYCGEPQSFYAAFSARTGRITSRALLPRPRQLIAGDRITELVDDAEGRTTLRDLVTGRTKVTLPDEATGVQGAGPFVAWNVPATAAGANSDTTTHVVRVSTGRQRYAINWSRIAAATGDPEADVDRIVLSPTGSLDVEAYATGNGRPVTVDPVGRTHRLAVPLRSATEFSTKLRGHRVALRISDGCRGAQSWVTSRDGRSAFDLDAIAPLRRTYPSEAPVFLTGRALAWTEESSKHGRSRIDRMRVVPDVRRLPMTTASRPRCT